MVVTLPCGSAGVEKDPVSSEDEWQTPTSDIPKATARIKFDHSGGRQIFLKIFHSFIVTSFPNNHR
jgi:hypothetical protein